MTDQDFLTLAERFDVFKQIIDRYGMPTHISRPANFETLLRLILEQQVSLSSAKATHTRLCGVAGELSIERILSLSDEAFREATVSRQKTTYIRILAQSILDKTLDLQGIHALDDEAARAHLTALKGIGNWTADVFLMECLGRLDVFPIGDVALRTAMKTCLALPADTSHDDLIALAEAYRPLRSVATVLFWHDYIHRRNIDLKSLIT
jgi:DNA-3-methyladenine glycosylase II